MLCAVRFINKNNACMREYVIRNGSMYFDTHYLYENMDEFRKEIPSDKIKLSKWGKDDFKEYTTGDYVNTKKMILLK